MGIISRQFSVLFLSIFTFVFNYILNVYLTQNLLPPAYGQIVLIVRIFNFCAPIVLLGSNYALTKFMPEYLELQKFYLFHSFNSWAMRIYVGASAIVLLLFLVLIVTNDALKMENVFFLNHFYPYFYTLLLIPLLAYMLYQVFIFLAYHKQFLYLFSTIIHPLITLIFLFLLKLYFLHITIYSVIFSIGASYSLIIIFQHCMLRRYIPPKQKEERVPTQKTYSQWRYYSLQLLTNALLYIAINSIDIVMLRILDNSTNVAKLSVLMTIVNIFYYIEGASNSIISPMISPLAAKNDLKGLQYLFDKIIAFKMMTGIILLLIIIYFGKGLLIHFGEFYVHLYPLLICLGIVNIFYLYLGSSTPFLNYGNHAHVISQGAALQLIIAIVAELILIPFFHVLGAVIGMSLGMLISETLLLFSLRYYLKIKIFIFA